MDKCPSPDDKNPVDRTGKSIVPPGLDLRTARYFPLAKLLPAFDGAISAAGYNSIHEFMCAGTPTILFLLCVALMTN